jgi:hypothetical protein
MLRERRRSVTLATHIAVMMILNTKQCIKSGWIHPRVVFPEAIQTGSDLQRLEDAGFCDHHLLEQVCGLDQGWDREGRNGL